MEFSAFIIAVFVVYRRVTYQKSGINDNFVLDFLLWALIPWVDMVIIICMGQKITTEGKSTAKFVHKKMRSSKRVEVVSKVFLSHTLISPPISLRLMDFLYAAHAIFPAASASCSHS